MGFNIEQYELGDVYSNVSGNDALRGAGTICVKGKAIYLPSIYAGLQLTKKGRAKISENRQICQARQAEKAPTTAPSTEEPSRPSAPASIDAPMGGTPDATKSNTAMYIGIGVGVLVIGIVAIILIRKK